MSHGGHSEGEAIRPEVQQHQAPQEAVYAQLAGNQAGSDNGSDARRINPMNDSRLDSTREHVTGTVYDLVGRNTEVSKAGFQVMKGAIELGVQIRAFSPDGAEYIAKQLQDRAQEQSNPVASRGLTNLADYVRRTASA
jgi:hypothetical protein